MVQLSQWEVRLSYGSDTVSYYCGNFFSDMGYKLDYRDLPILYPEEERKVIHGRRMQF